MTAGTATAMTTMTAITTKPRASARERAGRYRSASTSEEMKSVSLVAPPFDMAVSTNSVSRPPSPDTWASCSF
jgi:hypothetical protein